MKRKPKIKRRVWKAWMTDTPFTRTDFGHFLLLNVSSVKWGTFQNRAKITVEWEQ